jgi:hypothetical protein
MVDLLWSASLTIAAAFQPQSDVQVEAENIHLWDPYTLVSRSQGSQAGKVHLWRCLHYYLEVY